MDIQKISQQQRMVQNYGFAGDYTLEFSNRFPQCFGSQQQFPDSGLCFQSPIRDDDGSQKQNIWPDNSSSTMISHIGPPSTAFFATERYMGLAQYDSRDNKDSSCCSQLSKNYDIQQQVPSPYEQTGNVFFADSCAPVEATFHSKNGLQLVKEGSKSLGSPHLNSDGPYRNPFSNLSEKERILHLKNKLLGDCDIVNIRRPSVSFDGNQDGVVSFT